MTHVAEVPSTPEDKNPTLVTATVKDSDTDAPTTENDSEKSLRSKLIELGDETAKKLKEILSEVDKDELKKSLDKDKALNFLAGALDSLNGKVQGLLAPKGETRKNEEDSTSESSESDATSAAGDSVTAGTNTAPESSVSEAAEPAPEKPKSKPKAKVEPGPVGTEAIKPEAKEDTSTSTT